MLADAINRLVELGQNSREIKLIHQDAYSFYYNIGGEIEAMEKSPPPIKVTTYDLESFCKATDWLVARQGGTSPTHSVWVGEEDIVALLDAETRLHRVTMPLEYNPVFQRLEKLQDQLLTQQDLISLLKYDLETVLDGAELLAAVRHIKFRTGASGESNIQHGRESMGRSIDAEVTGAGDMPDAATIRCRVFDIEEIAAVDIHCDLQILPEKQLFRFRPRVNQLSSARRSQIDDITEFIRDALKIHRVYRGEP